MIERMEMPAQMRWRDARPSRLEIAVFPAADCESHAAR